MTNKHDVTIEFKKVWHEGYNKVALGSLPLPVQPADQLLCSAGWAAKKWKKKVYNVYTFFAHLEVWVVFV